MNPIAYHRPNSVTAHLARRISDDPMLILEQHPESAVGKDFVDNTFNCEQSFFRHEPTVRVRRDAQDRASRGYLALRMGRARKALKTFDIGW